MNANSNDTEKWIDENIVENEDFCSLYFQERWDGFGNELDTLSVMRNRGWELIASDIQYFNHIEGKCIADKSTAELLFKKVSPQ